MPGSKSELIPHDLKHHQIPNNEFNLYDKTGSK